MEKESAQQAAENLEDQPQDAENAQEVDPEGEKGAESSLEETQEEENEKDAPENVEENTPEEVKEPETIEDLKEAFQKELSEKEDKYMRLAAEFENFKKRSLQEIQSRVKFASQSLALNVISGLDSLERALSHAKEEENEQLKEFITGIEMVQQQFLDALNKNNIERIDPQGERFDPNIHEAMGVIETDAVEPDHIASVFQPGYILHDRVIRPAMVQVAKK